MPEDTGPEIIDLTGLSESSDEEDEDEVEDDEHSGEDGSEDEVEIPIDATTRVRLHEAITSVSDERLRHMLIRLSDTTPAVEEALMRELLTLKRKTVDVISRWETCSNCDEEYDMGMDREVDECIFHPGELEVDEDKFVDWDEDCHGPKDTSENRRSFPQNFDWSCCEGDGKSEGCVRGFHRQLSRKKQRV